jgi:hypothetical protein
MYAIFGKEKTKQYGNIVVQAKGEIHNVSSADPLIVEIDFVSLARLNRIMVRNITDDSITTIVELFSVDPSNGFHEYDRVYFNNKFEVRRRDDKLTDIIYIQPDGLDKIWLRLTPSNGTSNRYEFLLDGVKMVKDGVISPAQIL